MNAGVGARDGSLGRASLALAGAAEPLSRAHAARLVPLLQARGSGQGEQAIADLSFANLWLFRRAHDWQFCDGDWPVIRGHAYDGQRHVLPLFALAEAPQAVLRALLQPGEGFFPLAAAEAQALDPARFSVHSVRDDADYLYRAQTFRDYAAPGLHNKRNLLKQCLAAHRLTHAPYTPTHHDAARLILREWLQDKHKQAGDADDLPCQEALLHVAELGWQGFVTWADGEPAGFVLAEELQPGVAVVRFAKGLARFKGISQALFQHLACEGGALFGRPLNWLNFEQDLGLPNFRRTKLSYQPHALLAKYRVGLK